MTKNKSLWFLSPLSSSSLAGQMATLDGTGGKDIVKVVFEVRACAEEGEVSNWKHSLSGKMECL